MIFGKKNQRDTMPEGATRQGARLGPSGHPIRRLEPFFRRKKANFRVEIVSKIQPNRSYRSPVIKETMKGHNLERRNRERQRDRSNLGGALAPPMPWKPRTRGETLLPSREKVKEEEEGGGRSPSLPVAPKRRRGHHHHRNLHQQLHRRHHQLFPPLCSSVTPLLPVVIST